MTDQKSFVSKCHTGNSVIYKEPQGGTLYIGGWNQGATFDWNTHVIDLTGNEHRYWDIPIAYDEKSREFLPFLMQNYAGWLSLPFPDYGVPAGMDDYKQWYNIAMKIKEILMENHDVLVACHGGHGRSGMFCAIVGYILNINSDKSWESPVEKIRTIHCLDSVETYKQEKFVYDILGLRIQINRTYYADDFAYGTGAYGNGVGMYNGADRLGYSTTGVGGGKQKKYLPCPICNNSSMYVEDFGMCLQCQSKFTLAPKVSELTLEMISTHGNVEHKCTKEKCFGIWRAEKCGHVVHDQIIYEGLCEICWAKQEEQQRQIEQHAQLHDELCAICGKNSIYSSKYGLCWDCQEDLGKQGLVDEIHNSITDPYRFVEHQCDAGAMCVGIIQADVCGHVVHNREVQEGLCPLCYDLKHSKEAA